MTLDLEGLGGVGGSFPFERSTRELFCVSVVMRTQTSDLKEDKGSRFLLLYSSLEFWFVLGEREHPAVCLRLKSYFYISAGTSSSPVNSSILMQHFPQKHFPFPREPEPHPLPTCVWKQGSWRERSYRLSTGVLWRLKSPRPPIRLQIHPFLASPSLAFVEEVFPIQFN